MKSKSTVATGSFTTAVAALLEPWGLPAAQGRVFAYLLLQAGPVSLDQMAQELGISKVGAWKAATELEGFGHIQRHGVAGSKLRLYSAADRISATLLKQGDLLGALADLLETGSAAAANAQAAQRVADTAHLYRSVQQAIHSAVAGFERQKAKRPPMAAASGKKPVNKRPRKTGVRA